MFMLGMPRSSHNALEPIFEPLDSILACDLVALANLGLAPSPLRNTGAGAVPKVYVSHCSAVLTSIF